jgi:hypothetical protein
MLIGQWLALGSLLAVIKWGHIWRQKTNLKLGITEPDDEQSPPDQSEPTPEAADVDVDVDVEKGSERPNRIPWNEGNVTQATESGRGGMPPVQVVLSRTVSMSRPTAHGGH